MPDAGEGYGAVEEQPRETLAQVDEQRDLFLRQRDVLGLEELFYRRLWDGVADSKQLIFGGGALPEFTLIGGGVQERYAGAFILNYSAAALAIGFAASAGLFTGYVVNPGMWMTIPQNYVDLSVAVSAAAAAGPQLNPITIIRTYVPPRALESGLLVSPVAIADTLSAAGTAAAPAANAAIATIAAPGAGVYELEVQAAVDGTYAALDFTNIGVKHGATVLGPVIAAAGGAANMLPAQSNFPRVTLGVADNIVAYAIANATGGTTYLASIQATRIL